MVQRILIVEDEPGWREHLASVLGGYDLLEAATVAEACRLIDESQAKDRKIDLVLLDLGLSQLGGITDGQTVLAHLRQRDKQVPCIIITGRELSMSAAQRLFRQYNITKGLEKPDGLLDLEQVVTEALASAQTPTDRDAGEPAIDPEDPPVAAIRDLLTNAFTRDDLLTFCQDRTDFRPIATRVGPSDGLGDIASKVIEYCRTQLLWDQLLTEVKQINPRQYDRFQSQL